MGNTVATQHDVSVRPRLKDVRVDDPRVHFFDALSVKLSDDVLARLYSLEQRTGGIGGAIAESADLLVNYAPRSHIGPRTLFGLQEGQQCNTNCRHPC